MVTALQAASEDTQLIKLGGNSYNKEAAAAVSQVIAARFPHLQFADFMVQKRAFVFVFFRLSNVFSCQDMFTTRTTEQIVPAVEHLCQSVAGRHSMKGLDLRLAWLLVRLAGR